MSAMVSKKARQTAGREGGGQWADDATGGLHAGEYDDHAAGHVFAAMVADAFDDGECAGIAHAEAFAGAARRVHLAAGRTIQAGIADDDCIVRRVAGTVWRTHNDAAAGHALADAVVRLAV